MRRASAVAPPAPLDPLTIVTSVTKVCYLVGDVGVTPGATFTWADQTGTGNDHTQATAAQQPASGVDATLNGLTTVRFDGVDDRLDKAGFNFTTNYWIAIGYKAVTWTSGASLYGATSANARMSVGQVTGTPQIGQVGSTATGNQVSAALGSWWFLEAQFGTTTADFLRIGPTTNNATANIGTAGGTGRRLGGNAASSAFGQYHVYFVLVCTNRPTAGEISNLRTWASSITAGVMGV